MCVRYSKVVSVFAIALFASLVAFSNATDYNTNFQFVQHVFMMDTIFPDSSIMYRSISSPVLHHAGYLVIIVFEAITAILCWAGGLRMLSKVNAPAQAFNASKKLAVIGLTAGFLVWQVGFMSIGGEWFGMWMSSQWNGVPGAFRFLITILAVLIYIAPKDTDD